MTSRERENRSFVGCGEEEYLKGDITAHTAPVGYGLHDEILSQADRSRLLFEECMVRRSGVDGSPTTMEGRVACDGVPAGDVRPHTTVFVNDAPTCGGFCEAIGFDWDDKVLQGSPLHEFANGLRVCPSTLLSCWLCEHGWTMQDLPKLVPATVIVREAFAISIVTTVTPSNPERSISPTALPTRADILAEAKHGDHEYYVRQAIENWGESGSGLAGDLALNGEDVEDNFSADLFDVLRRMYIQVLRDQFPKMHWQTRIPRSLWDDRGWGR
ncbi:MAG: hypothetical protein PHO20_01615 [Candidatus Peribacteraceae bacterium]|nr:hypothetical protein [Candidatus Peribacteraceae bacterium]